MGDRWCTISPRPSLWPVSQGRKRTLSSTMISPGFEPTDDPLGLRADHIGHEDDIFAYLLVEELRMLLEADEIVVAFARPGATGR